MFTTLNLVTVANARMIDRILTSIIKQQSGIKMAESYKMHQLLNQWWLCKQQCSFSRRFKN